MNEDLESGRVTSQLEQTHDTNNAEKLENVVLSVEPCQQEIEVERDSCDEVDDVDRSAKKVEDAWTDGTADKKLEREPGVTRALDVEEGRVLIGGALIQQPDGTTAVRCACHRNVDEDRNTQVGMCFETEYCD